MKLKKNSSIKYNKKYDMCYLLEKEEQELILKGIIKEIKPEKVDVSQIDKSKIQLENIDDE